MTIMDAPSFPLVIKVEGKVSCKGVVKPKNSRAKISVAPNKVEVQMQLKGKLQEFKVKSGYDPKKGVKLGIEWTPAKIPFAFDLSLNPSITELLTASVKAAKPIAMSAQVAPNWEFQGVVDPQLSFQFGPNPKWTGWATTARAAASAVHSVFIGEMGAVTTVGVVAVGAGAGLSCVAVISYGLYEIGKANREGAWLALWRNFIHGYVKALTDLTSEVVLMKKEEAARLLKIQPEERMAQFVADWTTGGIGTVIANSDKTVEAGKAAALRSVDACVRRWGEAGWERVKAKQRAEYGKSDVDRDSRYRAILNAQLKTIEKDPNSHLKLKKLEIALN